MNTIETRKNAFDMLSEKQQNPKQCVYHYLELGVRGRTRLEHTVPSSSAACNLGAVRPQAGFTSVFGLGFFCLFVCFKIKGRQ